MADIPEEIVRNIVREEIAASPEIGGLKSDVSTLKSDVSILKSDVAVLKTDVATLKTDISFLKDEQQRHGVILENLETKFDTVIEMLTDNLNVKQKVGNHDERLEKLEADNKLVKSTVSLHSKQLAGLG